MGNIIMAIKVSVLLHKASEGGYWVEVPSMPECVSQGETRSEALQNIREALLLHFESLGAYRAQNGSQKAQVATVLLSG